MLAAVKEYKSVISGALFVLTMLGSLVAASQVPRKLDKHMQQTNEITHQLRVLVCLQAKLDVPLRCIANTP